MSFLLKSNCLSQSRPQSSPVQYCWTLYIVRKWPKVNIPWSLKVNGYVPVLVPKNLWEALNGADRKDPPPWSLRKWKREDLWEISSKATKPRYEAPRTPLFRPCWMNHFIRTKPKRSKLCDIYSAVWPLFQGTTNHKLAELVAEHRDTLTVLWSHRGSETLDFQESRVSFWLENRSYPPHI